jgi:tRNA modification GTPase
MAVQVADRAFRPRRGAGLAESKPGELRYGHIVDGDESIDDVVASRPPDAGDAVDICSHGGVRVVERILSLLERLGAPFRDDVGLAVGAWHPRSAIEAEALQAMALAKTERALSFLAFQREQLPAHLDRLADDCVGAPQAAEAELARLLHTYPAARALTSGWTVAIVGPPNSGKSTLFNRLVGRTRAVVSPQAGTTRDWIEEVIDVDGLPVRLIDTAGRHDTPDSLEAQAIRAGSSVIDQADLLLLVLDRSAPLPDRLSVRSDSRCIVVANKSDLVAAWTFSDLVTSRLAATVQVSAATGDGIPELLRLWTALSGLAALAADLPGLFAPRHRDLAQEARSALAAGRSQLASDIIKQQFNSQIG